MRRIIILLFFLFVISVRAQTYTIMKTDKPPVINGDLSEFEQAYKIQFVNTDGDKIDIRALWDATGLYLGYDVTDDEIMATVTERDGQTYRDDGAEWFVDTMNDDGTSTQPDDFHFVVNVSNVQSDMKGGQITWNGQWQSEVFRGTTEYRIEAAITWAMMGMATPQDNSLLRLGLATNDTDTDSRKQSLWPHHERNIGFNNPSNWSQMVLSDIKVNADSLLDVAGWHIWVTTAPTGYIVPDSARIDTLKPGDTHLDLVWEQPITSSGVQTSPELGLDYANARTTWVPISDVILDYDSVMDTVIVSSPERIFTFSSGLYAIQVDAEDEAGNVSALSNALWFYAKEKDEAPAVPVKFRAIFRVTPGQ